MGVEHIGIGAASLFDGAENQEGIGSQRQLVFDELIGMFTIQQTGPRTDLPTHRPTCRHVTTGL